VYYSYVNPFGKSILFVGCFVSFAYFPTDVTFVAVQLSMLLLSLLFSS